MCSALPSPRAEPMNNLRGNNCQNANENCMLRFRMVSFVSVNGRAPPDYVIKNETVDVCVHEMYLMKYWEVAMMTADKVRLRGTRGGDYSHEHNYINVNGPPSIIRLQINIKNWAFYLEIACVFFVPFGGKWAVGYGVSTGAWRLVARTRRVKPCTSGSRVEQCRTAPPRGSAQTGSPLWIPVDITKIYSRRLALVCDRRLLIKSCPMNSRFMHRNSFRVIALLARPVPIHIMSICKMGKYFLLNT